MAKASAGKSALTRQLLLLDSFSVSQPFLTISQLSRRSGLPLSTTHRLMAELAEAGLVDRLDDKTYRLGVRLWELACRTPGALGLRETASPYLLEAHASRAATRPTRHRRRAGRAVSGAPVHDGRRRLDDDHRRATAPACIGDRIGAAGGLGSGCPCSLPGRAMPSYTEATIHEPRTLRSALSDVRRQGYAVTDGHIHPSARGVAVPVIGAAGETVAAIGAVVPNDGQPWMHIVQTLRTAAQRTTTALRAAALPASDPDASPGGRYRALVHSSDRSMEFLSRDRPIRE